MIFIIVGAMMVTGAIATSGTTPAPGTKTIIIREHQQPREHNDTHRIYREARRLAAYQRERERQQEEEEAFQAEMAELDEMDNRPKVQVEVLVPGTLTIPLPGIVR